MAVLEVLILELLAIDGLATSALDRVGKSSALKSFLLSSIFKTYVATSEITTLKHEVGDDSVEGRARVAKALLTSAESTEVLGRLGDVFCVELELDTAQGLCKRRLVSQKNLPKSCIYGKRGRTEGKNQDNQSLRRKWKKENKTKGNGIKELSTYDRPW